MMPSLRTSASVSGFVAVSRGELDGHASLSWPLFDADGTPLLAEGERLPSDTALDWLFTIFAPHRPLPDVASREGREPVDGVSGAAYLHGLPVSLPIGAWLQVRVAPDAQPARVRTRLVGRSPSGMLLITPPMGAEARLPVTAGDRLALWTFPGDNLYEFMCDVRSIHRTPFEYLVLSRPSHVRKTPVRRTPRAEVRLMARAVPSDEVGASAVHGVEGHFPAVDVMPEVPGDAPPEWWVVVRDISTEGAGIVAQSPLPASCRYITLQFRVPVGADVVDVMSTAKVRHTDGPHSDGSWSYGLEFMQLDARNRAAVRCFVSEVRMADPRAWI